MDLEKILTTLDTLEEADEIENRRGGVTEIRGEIAVIRNETEERENTIKTLEERISHLQDVNNNLNLQLRAEQGNPSDKTTPQEQQRPSFDVSTFFG